MAERRPVIPENQLLDLIQNPSKAQGLAQKQIRERSLRGLFSPAALKGRLSFLLAKMAKGRKNAIGLGGVNRLFYVLIGVLFIILVLQFVFSIKHVSSVPDFTADPLKVSREFSEEIAATASISDYLDKPHIRDIFKFGANNVAPKKEEAAVEEEEVAPPEDDPGSLGHLELVGIGFSDDPDAMIKDIKTEEVFFLKRGDWIEGDIKVEAIFRDRVILSYKGKEIELR